MRLLESRGILEARIVKFWMERKQGLSSSNGVDLLLGLQRRNERDFGATKARVRKGEEVIDILFSQSRDRYGNKLRAGSNQVANIIKSIGYDFEDLG